MPHTYTYVILRHQPSLGSAAAEDFAVLVEGQSPNGWVVFAVGRSPSQAADVSPIGASIAQRFPNTLTEILVDISRTKATSEALLDQLQQRLRWNFHVSNPRRYEDDESIDRVAYKLFAQHVAHSSDLLRRVTSNSGPVQETHSGQTFTTAISVPEPTLELFAGVPV
jgi:hypothetical protein